MYTKYDLISWIGVWNKQKKDSSWKMAEIQMQIVI